MGTKDEPLPGHKVEKRRKRKWDRKPEIATYWWGGERYDFAIYFEVPHITFREKRKKKKKK